MLAGGGIGGGTEEGDESDAIVGTGCGRGDSGTDSQAGEDGLPEPLLCLLLEVWKRADKPIR